MSDYSIDTSLEHKLENLRDYFRKQVCVAVSFSGGVDSTLLLAVAHEILGDKVIAVTESSALYPHSESDDAVKFCKERGIQQILAEHDIQDMEWTKDNPRDRCYLCKKTLFADLRQRAEVFALDKNLTQSPSDLVYVEGSNESDLSDYRPGSKAVKELGVESPLLLVRMTKDEVRLVSRFLGLPTWNKPSYACLASRFPYGDEITTQRLERVERAEALLRSAGFVQCRVRVHDRATVARVEVNAQDIGLLLEFLQRDGARCLHEYGFKHVSVDAEGYRMGSMN